MTKTIVVTGARGYIGRNLTHMLCNRQYDYILYDLDIENSYPAKPIECDYLVHLAAPSTVGLWDNDPAEAMLQLEAANRWLFHVKPRHVVFASTACTQGLYAWSKRSTEQLIAGLWPEEHTILRLHNVCSGYYPRSRNFTHLFPRLMSGELEIEGDGFQIRDFIHVWDVCDIILDCIGYPTDRQINAKYRGEKIREVGRGIPVSVIEVIQQWLWGGEWLKIKRVPTRITHIDRQCAEVAYMTGMLSLRSMIRDCGYVD